MCVIVFYSYFLFTLSITATSFPVESFDNTTTFGNKNALINQTEEKQKTGRKWMGENVSAKHSESFTNRKLTQVPFDLSEISHKTFIYVKVRQRRNQICANIFIMWYDIFLSLNYTIVRFTFYHLIICMSIWKRLNNWWCVSFWTVWPIMVVR